MSLLKKYQKFISGFAILTFFITSLTLPPQAFGQELHTSEFHVGIPLDSKDLIGSFVPLGIPPELASIDEAFLPGSKDNQALPLIHIQSVHAHAETQKKIYALLKFLDEKYGIRSMFIEGAAEEVNPNYFRFFDDNSLNVQVAEKLVEKGELTGAELFLIESQKKIPTYGIEDPDLYRENLTSFQNVMLQRSLTSQFAEDTRGLLDRLETVLLNSDARKLLRSNESFEAGRLELFSYVLELERKTREILGVDLRYFESQFDWPQLIRLLRLQEIESKLDPEQIQTDRQKLIGFLNNNQIEPSLVDTFQNLTFSPFQSGMVYDPGFKKNDLPRYLAERLVVATREKGFTFDEYPYFTRYLEAAILQSELEAERLFNEMEMLFEKLVRKVSTKEEEWKLVELTKEERLYERLFDLELTPKDYARVELLNDTDRPLVRLLLGMESLQEKTRLGTKSLVPSNIDTLESVFDQAISFYRLAKEREEVMVDKILKSNSANQGPQLTVLITGGFHTEGLSRSLRKKAIPYTIVTPRVMEQVSTEDYVNMLLGEKKTAFDVSYLEPVIRSESRAIKEQMYPEDMAQKMIRSEIRAAMEAIAGVMEEETRKGKPRAATLVASNLNNGAYFRDNQFELRLEGDLLVPYLAETLGGKREHLTTLQGNPFGIKTGTTELQTLLPVAEILRAAKPTFPQAASKQLTASFIPLRAEKLPKLSETLIRAEARTDLGKEMEARFEKLFPPESAEPAVQLWKTFAQEHSDLVKEGNIPAITEELRKYTDSKLATFASYSGIAITALSFTVAVASLISSVLLSYSYRLTNLVGVSVLTFFISGIATLALHIFYEPKNAAAATQLIDILSEIERKARSEKRTQKIDVSKDLNDILRDTIQVLRDLRSPNRAVKAVLDFNDQDIPLEEAVRIYDESNLSYYYFNPVTLLEKKNKWEDVFRNQLNGFVAATQLLQEGKVALEENDLKVFEAAGRTLIVLDLLRRKTESDEWNKEEVKKVYQKLREKSPVVLIVDDERSLRELNANTLQGKGYRVVTAENAKQGLTKFGEGEYDLVLTDLQMPGMTGDQMAQKMREINPNQPILFLSGGRVEGARAEEVGVAIEEAREAAAKRSELRVPPEAQPVTVKENTVLFGMSAGADVVIGSIKKLSLPKTPRGAAAKRYRDRLVSLKQEVNPEIEKTRLSVKLFRFVLDYKYGFEVEGNPELVEIERKLADTVRSIFIDNLDYMLDKIDKGATAVEAIDSAVKEGPIHDFIKKVRVALRINPNDGLLKRNLETLQGEGVGPLKRVQEELVTYDLNKDDRVGEAETQHLAQRHQEIYGRLLSGPFSRVSFETYRENTYREFEKFREDFNAHILSHLQEGRSLEYAVALFFYQNLLDTMTVERSVEFLMQYYYEISRKDEAVSVPDQDIVGFIEKIEDRRQYQDIKLEARKHGRLVAIGVLKGEEELDRAPHWFIDARQDGVIPIADVDLKTVGISTLDELPEGIKAAVDGKQGQLLINPTPQTEEALVARKKDYHLLGEYYASRAREDIPGFTVLAEESNPDKYRGTPSPIFESGASGVGLHRVEALSEKIQTSEEGMANTFEEMLIQPDFSRERSEARLKPVAILRLGDNQDDKQSDILRVVIKDPNERKRFLRTHSGLQFYFSKKYLDFRENGKTQLRAFFRAHLGALRTHHFSALHILIPNLQRERQVDNFRKLFNEAKHEFIERYILESELDYFIRHAEESLSSKLTELAKAEGAEVSALVERARKEGSGKFNDTEIGKVEELILKVKEEEKEAWQKFDQDFRKIVSPQIAIISEDIDKIPIGYMFEDTKVIARRQSLLRKIKEDKTETGVPATHFVAIGSNDLLRTIRITYPKTKISLRKIHPLFVRDLWNMAVSAHESDPKMLITLDGELAGYRRVLFVLRALFYTKGIQVTPVPEIVNIPEIKGFARSLTLEDAQSFIGPLLEKITREDYIPQTHDELDELNDALLKLQVHIESKTRTQDPEFQKFKEMKERLTRETELQRSRSEMREGEKELPEADILMRLEGTYENAQELESLFAEFVSNPKLTLQSVRKNPANPYARRAVEKLVDLIVRSVSLTLAGFKEKGLQLTVNQRLQYGRWLDTARGYAVAINDKQRIGTLDKVNTQVKQAPRGRTGQRSEQRDAKAEFLTDLNKIEALKPITVVESPSGRIEAGNLPSLLVGAGTAELPIAMELLLPKLGGYFRTRPQVDVTAAMDVAKIFRSENRINPIFDILDTGNPDVAMALRQVAEVMTQAPATLEAQIPVLLSQSLARSPMMKGLINKGQDVPGYTMYVFDAPITKSQLLALLVVSMIWPKEVVTEIIFTPDAKMDKPALDDLRSKARKLVPANRVVMFSADSWGKFATRLAETSRRARGKLLEAGITNIPVNEDLFNQRIVVSVPKAVWEANSVIQERIAPRMRSVIYAFGTDKPEHLGGGAFISTAIAIDAYPVDKQREIAQRPNHYLIEEDDLAGFIDVIWTVLQGLEKISRSA